MELSQALKTTEVGSIPIDWDAVPLSQVCSMKSGEGIISGRIDAHSDYPCYGGNGLRGFTSRFTHDGTHALVGRQGALCGNVLGVQGKFFASEHALVVAAKDNTDIGWLTLVLGRMRLNRYSESSAQPGLSAAKLLRLAVACPGSKAEQRAIAGVLSDADALIESLEQLLAKKRHLKQGAMQELLTGKKRLPGFGLHDLEETEVGLIPSDWLIRPLLSVVRIARGQVDPRVEPYRTMTLVAPDHIEVGTGRLLERVSAKDQGAISGKYLFTRGDVVYSKIRPYLRKAALVDFDGLCSADMYPLRPSSDVSAGFVLATILGHRFSKYAESVSARSGMPKINREELAAFAVALPPTKAEQDAIAAILSDMDSEIDAVVAKLTKARQIKQGMMQELLTGRIRLV